MTSRASRNYIEVDWAHAAKSGQLVSGDVFLCRKVKEEDRAVAVLSDGLGSGIKANVLATLTATMALKYAGSRMDIRRSAEAIMSTLPVCSVRRISYSTFTIVDIEGSGETRVMEFDNPPYLLIRGGRIEEIEKAECRVGARTIRYSRFAARLGDRIVFFSDGVSQAGMEAHASPLGWGRDKAGDFALRALEREARLSARDLARRLVAEARRLDGGCPRDDTTCGVICFREPRKLLVATGPPFNPARDRDLGEIVRGFQGRIAVCGGTTANIVSRILEREVRMDLEAFDPEIPPAAAMDGVDLVTEGTLTLGRVAALLEEGAHPERLKRNAATRLMRLLLDSDVVHFIVGTRINQAHQDPNIPVELDLRRNVVKKIAALLETRYVKETHTQYI